MGRFAAWIRTCGLSGTAAEATARQSLQAAGIHLTPHSGGDAQEPFGIIGFHEATEELFALLHAARRDGFRVIALALAATQCPPPVWQLLHAGASEVLVWDDDGVTAGHIRAKFERWSRVESIAHQASLNLSLIGQSVAWRTLVRDAVEMAHFTRAPVLITGESGTGKEMVARMISVVTGTEDGQEARKELITVDCGAVVSELSGSELFGHERGAFTGAHAMREGAFAQADGATLFLDEIGDVPPSIQVQLLRAIQEKTYKRVGGNTWYRTRFRLVCATNRDLKELVRQGLFRLDLYHRIAGCVIQMPPLREHKEDILPLASHFLRESIEGATRGFDEQVEAYLLNRSYPGNVRELRQLVYRIALRHTGDGPITAGDVPEEDRPAAGEFRRAWPDDRFEQSLADAITLGASLKEITQTATQTAIRIAVQSENGNLQRAARRLGITDRALQARRAAGLLDA